ncbi:hypothetical protein GA0070607_1478 [Micromonospora coriariae]|uniref:PknH-like extracellular domain-containing protein n=1 Tax=Micromonospora coriariae TaxID=285665 RepID=A0A1C4V2G1_9ACTN|nr:hypothetical protein [Micromonospora coriariae]SCE78005.1 hypothetical protein GA0070607_1478 [Micromonospora coriariae]
MSLRRSTLALLSLLLLAPAACAPSQAAEAPRWSAPAASASPTPPKPRPAPTSTAEVRSRVTKAMLNLDAKFNPETAQYTDENTDAWKLISLCRASLPSDIKRTAYRERLWDGETVWIRQYVVGYLKVPGRKLADELRSVLSTCKQYEVPDDGRTSTIVRPSPPPVPNGPDVITFCERLKGKATRHQCTLFLVRGNFVMEVDASASNGDLAAGTALIAKIAPLAVAALEKIA